VTPAIIRKTSGRHRVAPNLTDHEHAVATFSWANARAALDGLPGGPSLDGCVAYLQRALRTAGS
jgi:hypothetical protein